MPFMMSITAINSPEKDDTTWVLVATILQALDLRCLSELSNLVLIPNSHEGTYPTLLRSNEFAGKGLVTRIFQVTSLTQAFQQAETA